MKIENDYIFNNLYNSGDKLLFLADLLLNNTEYQNNKRNLNDEISTSTISLHNSLSDDDINTLRLIARILCSFSLAGLLFVLSIFIFFRSVRSFVLELAVWLCATNIFFNINVYFPINQKKNDGWCLTQGLISSFSDLSSMIWTTLIGFFSYFSVVKSGFIDKNKKNLRLCFIFIAYVIPGLFTIIVSTYSNFGNAGVWCWIQSDNNKTNIYQIIYYILTWIVVLLNTLFVTLLILNLQKLNCNDEIIAKYINKLKLYPMIQIVSLIPATINRIISLNQDKDYFWLLVIQIIFDSLTGLIFSIVYGFNPNVRTIIYDFFHGIFQKKSNEDINNILNNSDSIEHPNRKRNDSLKIYDDNIITSQHENN